MSWKLAEWRWREQAPLRERSLWKIWDVEDAVKNGDVVEEAVRLAYHFPDQLDGCWQSQDELPRLARLGSIFSATNSHPPPRSELPDLPQSHHASYHSSHSSSRPLLAPSEKNPPGKIPNSTSSSLSTLLSRSISSTPSCDFAPATPQLPTDFLDSRDWNHLALGQKVERNTAVNQLRSSFGLFSKAARDPHSSRRHALSPQHRSLGRTNSSAEPPFRRLTHATSQLHRRYKSADFSASLQSPHRVVPWSNLDTVFEHEQYFVKHYLQHEGTVFEVLDSLDSFGEYSAVSPQLSLTETPELFNSTSLLIPAAEMARLRFGKSTDGEKKTPKAERNDNTPSKVSGDSPSANLGMNGHSGEPHQIPPAKEMKNMTGSYKNLPPLIDLPKTPSRPGPASPALQQQLTEAKEHRPFFITSQTANSRGPRAERGDLLENVSLDVSVGDFVSREKQLQELGQLTPQETGPLSQKAMLRNSKSFFDLSGEARGYLGREIGHVSSRSSIRRASSASDLSDAALDVIPCRPRRNNALIRNSRDIIDIAISGDVNCTRQAEVIGFEAVPAALRINRQLQTAGQPPEISLPSLPAHGYLPQYRQLRVPSSEIAEYGNTQSVLNAAYDEQDAYLAEQIQAQMLEIQKATGDLRCAYAGHNPENILQDVSHDNFHDAHGFSENQSGHSQLESMYSSAAPSHLGSQDTVNHLPLPNKLSLRSQHAVLPLNTPCHQSLASICNAVEDNGPGPAVLSSQQDITDFRAFPRCDSTPADVIQHEAVGELATDDSKNAKGMLERRTAYNQNPGSAGWQLKQCERERIIKEDSNAQKFDDSNEWETVQTSGFQSQVTPQPQYENYSRATDASNLSLGNSSSSAGLSIRKPATPWDPLPRDTTRTHPPLPDTPHKYRLRIDTGSGKQFLVPEYSLPEFGHGNSEYQPFYMDVTATNLPKAYPGLISKFSSLTPCQQALGDDSSLDQDYPSSPPVFSQGQARAIMAASNEEEELAKDCIVHELEGDQIHGANSLITVADGNKAGIPKAESVYSLANVDIIQDEIVKAGVAGGLRPANNPGMRVAVSPDSSQDIPMRDGMQYGEQIGAIEMSNMDRTRNFSRIITGSGGNKQPTSSQLSLPFQQRLASQGRYESDECLMKRFSTIDNDGSFYGDDDGDEDAVSLSSMMREHDPVNIRAGTFAKRAIVGAKYNITGTLRGTGMRATGSSPADFSSDIYGSVMQRHHSCGQLSTGPEGNREGHSDEIVDAGTSPTTKVYLTRKQIKAHLQDKGLNVDLRWGNVQRNITGITLSSGHAISAPKVYQIPRTLPPVNSFALTKEQPLIETSVTVQEIQDRLEMAMDDWNRLQYDCPQFPLRDSHLTMKFLEGDPRCGGGYVCIRGGVSRVNGKIEEEAYCFYHQRREFSTLPSLRHTPLNAETLRLRKKAGCEVVWTLLSVPLFGWIILYYIWKQDPAMNVSGELMRWKTNNLIWEMGQEEVEFAGVALAWSGLALTGVAFGCLAVLLWVFL